MAAAGSHSDHLCDEATSPICLEHFMDAVTAESGHSFCRACVTQSITETSCPQCKETVPQRNLRRQEGESVCEKHQEPLKLFCKDHEVPICMVCVKSKVHKDHVMIPVEEASKEYTDDIHRHLEILRKEKENVLAYKGNTEKESQDLLKQTRAEREKTVAEFRQLHQFLEEQEKLLLAQLEEVEKEIAKKREEQLARLSKELFSVGSLIREMEEKCQQPASDFLKDIRSTLQRYEKKPFKNPGAFPLDLKWTICDCCDINVFLESVMKQFKDALGFGLQLQKANVTLDPATANPRLILSEDRKNVRLGPISKDLLKTPERFDEQCFVLSCEEFTKGRYFWEVAVSCEEAWGVGVTRKSVRRKGDLDHRSQKGIWGVWKLEGEYWASDYPQYVQLSLREEPKRIRLLLNYAGRRVVFFDADTAALLSVYRAAEFCREPLLPLFWVFKNAQLTISL